MSQYTTQLRYILENPMWTDERLGLGNYPIFDESYRANLNQKIKDFYYFEEIAYETPARFCFKLRQKMNLIMPYYNKLYQSELLKLEPFLNISVENELIEKVVTALKELSNTTSEATKNITSDSEKNDTNTTTAIEDINNNDINEKSLTNKSIVDISSESNLSNEMSENGDTITTYNSKVVDTKDLSNEDSNKSESSTTQTSENSKSYNKYSEHSSVNSAEEKGDTQKEVTSDTPNGLLDNFNMNSFKYADSARINNIDGNKKITESSDKTINGEILDSSNNSTNDTVSANSNHKESGTVTSDKSGHDDVSIKEHTVNTNVNESKKEKNTTDTSVTESSSNIFTSNKENNINSTGTINSSDKINELNNLINEVIHNLDNDTNKNLTSHQKGFTGVSMSRMLIEFRETFLNIDMMIIEELKDLFMLVMS